MRRADGASCQPAVAQRRMPCLDVEAAYLLHRWAGNSFALTWRPPGLVGRFVTGLSFSPCIQSISPKSLPRPFLRKMAARCAQFRKGANTWPRSARGASNVGTGSRFASHRPRSRRGRRQLEAPARNFEGRQARPDRTLGETKKAPAISVTATPAAAPRHDHPPSP